jgi:hypothetical protein
LNLDAMHQLKADDWREAVEDVLAIQRLGALLMQRGTTTQWDIGANFAIIALHLQAELCRFIPNEHRTEMIALLKNRPIGGATAMEACRWTTRVQSAAKLVEISKEYAKWRWEFPAATLRTDGIGFANETESTALLFPYVADNGPWSDQLARRAFQLRYFRIDWNSAASLIQMAQDEEESIDQMDDREQRHQQRNALYRRLGEGLSRSPWWDLRARAVRTSTVANELAQHYLVDWEKYRNTMDKLDCMRGLIDVVLALETFNLANQRYPDELAELIPDYIDRIPFDTFANQPLSYTREDDGYRVYSWGIDRKDDHGEEQLNEDIVISLNRSDPREPADDPSK